MPVPPSPSPATFNDTLIKTLTHQRDLLGTAIPDLAVEAGILRADAAPSGPELLMAADDIKSCLRDQREQLRQLDPTQKD